MSDIEQQDTQDAAVEAEPQVSPEGMSSDQIRQAFDEYEDNVLMELDPEPDPDDLVDESEYESDTEEEEAEGEAYEESPYDEGDDEPLSEQLESAINTLLRDGWEIDDLDALSDERLLQIAEHRRKVQTDVDRKLRERQQGTLDDETETDSEASNAEPNSDTPISLANLKEQAIRLADALGLDEEGTELLTGFQQAAMGPLQGIIQQQAEALQAIQQQILYQDLERLRIDMASEYPMVEDPSSERWQNVLDRMGDFLQSDKETNPRKAMEDAILLEFRDDLANQARADRRRVRDLREDGMVTTRSRPEPTPVYSTPEEREDAVLRILESNDPDKYKRARAIGKANF